MYVLQLGLRLTQVTMSLTFSGRPDDVQQVRTELPARHQSLPGPGLGQEKESRGLGEKMNIVTS